MAVARRRDAAVVAPCPDVGVDPHLTGVDLRDGRGELRLRRAWPRHPAREGSPLGSLVVEAVGDDGRVVALEVADGRARVVGEDPRLPGLRGRHARAGVLRAHRAGKRAVLAVGTGEPRYWVKVVRPAATERGARAAGVVADLLAGVAGAPRLPAVLEVDRARGALVLSPLAGVDLATVLRAGGPGAGAAAGSATEVQRAGDEVGQLLAVLAAVPVTGAPLPGHHLDDEAEVLGRSVADAVAVGVVRGATAARLVAAATTTAGALRALPPLPAVLAHRDLHDGQLLLLRPEHATDPAAALPGLLDLDTAALADPALDAGNLLAHLDLAATQGHGDAARAVAAGALSRLAVDPGRLQVLRRAAALRLCAVHAYRPAAATIVPALLSGDTRVAPWD